MKFVNYLKEITGVSIYPLISLFIFVAFFIGVAWYVYKTPKSKMNAKANIPLEQ